MKQLFPDDIKLAIDRCCEIYGDSEMIVVGSLSILGSHSHPAPALSTSSDIFIYFFRYRSLPKEYTGRQNDLVSNSVGRGTEFNDEHGFYIEGVAGWTTMTTPPGWQERLVPVRTERGNTGWCLAPIDLAFNKIEAAREKDINYMAHLLDQNHISLEQLRSVILSSSRYDENRDKNLTTLAQVEAAWANLSKV